MWPGQTIGIWRDGAVVVVDAILVICVSKSTHVASRERKRKKPTSDENGSKLIYRSPLSWVMKDTTSQLIYFVDASHVHHVSSQP